MGEFDLSRNKAACESRDGIGRLIPWPWVTSGSESDPLAWISPFPLFNVRGRPFASMADKLEEFGQKRKVAADKDHGDLSIASCPPHHPSATVLSSSSEWVASKTHVPKQVVLLADETLIRSVQQADTENHAGDTGTATTRDLYKPIKIMRCTASISYMRPTANTAETPAFLLMGICNLQMEYIGRTRMERSERRLQEAEKIETALGLRQRPGVEGFQIFSRGPQAKMSQKKTKVYTARLLHIRKWIAP